MTKQWKDKPGEVAPGTPEYLLTAKSAWPFFRTDPIPMPPGLRFPRPADRAELSLARPELPPNSPHHGSKK